MYKYAVCIHITLGKEGFPKRSFTRIFSTSFELLYNYTMSIVHTIVVNT